MERRLVPNKRISSKATASSSELVEGGHTISDAKVCHSGVDCGHDACDDVAAVGAVGDV